MRSLLLFVLTACIFSYAQSADAASFDCSKARSIPEHLICNTPELSMADDQLKTDVDTARGLVIDKKQFAKELTSRWNWREKNCQDVQCLTAWYERQHQTLTALISSLSSGQVVKNPIPVPAAPPLRQPDSPKPKKKFLTASEIIAAYQENSIAADRRFKDQGFAMESRVASVGTDIDQHLFLALFTNYPGTYLKAVINDNERDTLATLRRLDVVRMQCVGDGLDTSGEIPIISCGDVTLDAPETIRSHNTFTPDGQLMMPNLRAVP